MKKSGIITFCMILTIIIFSCSGNKSKIDKDFLLKNKFLGQTVTLTFENETNYKIAGSESGCNWSNEGTYTIEGEKIQLHPVKCENNCDEKADPCKSTVGEAICTFVEIAGKKKMHVQSPKNEYCEDYIIVDKLNPCAEIKKEHANVGDGPTEIDGQWMSLDDSKEMIQYKDERWVILDSDGNEIGPDGNYKLSNIEMIGECLGDPAIKSLKKGKFINSSNMVGSMSTEYKIEGDVLTIGKSKYKRVNRKNLTYTDTSVINLSKKILKLIKAKNYTKIAEFIHPTIGIRFSAYPTINTEKEKVISKDEMTLFHKNKKERNWGNDDGTGDAILLNVDKYFDKFVYDAEFLKAEKIGFNESFRDGTSINNIKEIYQDAVYVEFYFSGFDKQFEGLDWKALRLVFKKINEKLYLIAVVHACWTT